MQTSDSTTGAQAAAKVTLLYDRACPACRNVAQRVRLEKSLGPIRLINAREESSLRQQITQQGYDLDEGMIVKLDQQIFYGADALHILALISSRSDAFNKLNFWLFGSQARARLFYPLFKALRRVLLAILRRGKIENPS